MFHKDAFQHGKRGISGKSIWQDENDCNKIVRTIYIGKLPLNFLSLFLCSRKKQKNEYALGKSSMLFQTTQCEKYFTKKYHYLGSSRILNGTQCLIYQADKLLKRVLLQFDNGRI
jgi:hypothetical protein